MRAMESPQSRRLSGRAPLLRPGLPAALLAALLAAPLLHIQPAMAQPARWDIRVAYIPLGVGNLPPPFHEYPLWLWPLDTIGPGDEEIYRTGEIYPGEPANLTFQLANTDCSRREAGPHVERFEDAWLEDLEPMIVRAHDLNKTGFIRDYELYGFNIEGFGERLRGDWELRIHGYCAGEPIHVESATVWFAWRGIGKALNATARLDRTLRALDPISYILRRDVESFSAVFTVEFAFPPHVPPDELERQPTLTLRLRYPSGHTYEHDYNPTTDPDRDGLRVWGFAGTLYYEFRLYPYRTFSLRVTDSEGGLPLPGAKVVMKAHVYPFKHEAAVDEDGVLRVWRLPDYYTYEVKVNYTVPWLGEERAVLVSGPHEAYEMALAGEMRTELYTLRIAPLDRQGRALEGARVRVSPEGGQALLENSSTAGYASFYLIPKGNYTVSVGWKGVEVFRGHRYVGTHPTLGSPPTSFSVSASVDDLVARATDMAGNPVGAVFTVRGPTAETSLQGIEAPDGLLMLQQMPVADYLVTAANHSKAFGTSVEAGAEVRPGEPREIRIPLYGVALKAVSMDGKPLQGASVRLHTVEAATDLSGSAVFPGVPRGTYGVEVEYKGVAVYAGSVRVDGNVQEALECSVYDVRVRFTTAEGEPIAVVWRLSGPAGSLEGRGEGFTLELLPEAAYRLSAAYIREGREVRLLEEEVHPSRLRDAAVRLPIGDLRLRVAWGDGTPFEGEARILGESRRVDAGRLTIPLLPFGQYNLTLLSGGLEVLRREITHGAGEATITVPSLAISVRVVDALGRPVEGASVSLQSPRVPGGTLLAARTGRDGSAAWPRVPEAFAPYWVSVTYAGQRLEQQALPGENQVALPGIVLAGMLVEVWHLLAAAAALGTLAAVALLLRRVGKKSRGSQER